MKIIRNGIEYSLTETELLMAYQEFLFNQDTQYVKQKLQSDPLFSRMSEEEKRVTCVKIARNMRDFLEKQSEEEGNKDLAYFVSQQSYFANLVWEKRGAKND